MCLSHEQHNLGDCPSILGTSFGQTLAAHIEDRDCRSNAPHSLIIHKEINQNRLIKVKWWTVALHVNWAHVGLSLDGNSMVWPASTAVIFSIHSFRAFFKIVVGVVSTLSHASHLGSSMHFHWEKKNSYNIFF